MHEKQVEQKQTRGGSDDEEEAIIRVSGNFFCIQYIK